MEDVPLTPVPAKAPRTRVAKGETVKRPRGKPPKKPQNSKGATKRIPVVAGKDSGGENFDIDGFTDLDDSENELECRPPKPTLVRQGR